VYSGVLAIVLVKKEELGQDMNAVDCLVQCVWSAEARSVHPLFVFFFFWNFRYPGELLMGTVEHACPMWRSLADGLGTGRLN